LVAEYAGNAAMAPKMADLAARFASVRRVRGDGSCFYRALLFGVCERLVVLGASDAAAAGAALARLRSIVSDARDALASLGYDASTTGDFADAADELLARVPAFAAAGAAAGVAALAVAFAEDGAATWATYYARLLTSLQLRAEPDALLPVLEADHPALLAAADPVAAYCEAAVEPAWVEADAPQVAALAARLRVPTFVAYTDAAASAAAATVLSFGPSADAPDAAPPVWLLYRPGHYDLLYPRTG
jgi:ubiquitin thioesterase protein OTUB1